MRELSGLPEEWIEASIGTVAHNANNLRKPISLKKRADIKGQYPYYGATGQIDSLNDYTHEGEYILIGEDGANLLSKSKPLSFIANGKYWVNNHAHSLHSLAEMPSQFISLYINSLSLAPWVTGSAQPKLTRGNLDSIPVPLPPLAEQKVIADKLHSLLAQVETTKARLDRVPDILKRFRQSVLAAAVSGRLISRKSPYQAKKLDSLCLPESSITYGVIKLGKEVEGGIPCLRTSNVRWLNIETCSIKCIASDISENYSRTVLGGGEVLVNVRGTLGGVAVVPNEMAGWNVSREVAVVPLDSNVVDAKFIALWIASRKSQQWLADVSKGVAYVGINLKDLRDLPVELPNTLEEQREIVRFVEDNFAFADAVEQKAQAASERVNKLTQSILAKAFRGELTADWRAANPDLISGENSAEALLEKIKVEREALKPKKKTRAKKVKG